MLAERVAPAAVQDRLAGRRVLLVAAPDAAGSLVDGLVPLLEAAGATVTTTVRLRPDLLDPTKQPTSTPWCGGSPRPASTSAPPPRPRGPPPSWPPP